MNKIQYTKAPLTFDQQLELLTERGLIISDKERANNFLSRINYYRLSAYYVPFEKSKHQFKNNVYFSDIQNIYEFDKKLRNLIYEAVETIEIALRTSIAYYLVNKHNAFIHEDQNIFFNHKRYIFS